MKTQMEYAPAISQMPPKLIAAYQFIAICNSHMGYRPFFDDETEGVVYQGLEEEQQLAFDLACWEVQKYFKEEKSEKPKPKRAKSPRNVYRADEKGGTGG